MNVSGIVDRATAIGAPKHRGSKASWPRALRTYLGVYLTWLLLYALLGKGFAYAGVAPVYVGEVLLLASLPIIIVSGRVADLMRTPIGMALAVFTVWQTGTALTHVSDYGIDTLRDSVVWAYSLFAWVFAACVIRLRGFITQTVLPNYTRFAKVYLIFGPIAVIATLFLKDLLPTWPGTGVTVPAVKVGEFSVHLAGILAFGLSSLSSLGAWMPLVVIDTVLTFGGRGGLLAFLGSAAFILATRPRLGHVLSLTLVAMILLCTMAAFDVRFLIPGTSREFSLNQLEDSVISVISNSPRQDLEGTKRWRLEWWGKIWAYTVEGEFFWQGKGYGINLADSDGFQVGTKDEPLRSPHNSHLTLLARSGVPGFFFWIALQAIWSVSLWRAYKCANRLGPNPWIGLFLWLLAYWLAFMISAAFDVFLEGPMAGIPFWTLFGLGWGAHTLFYSQLPTNRALTNRP